MRKNEENKMQVNNEQSYYKEHLDHLKRVVNESKKMVIEYQENPIEFGHFENRLFWAIRGVDPYKSSCSKHNCKITKNEFGEFFCGDCIEEYIHGTIDKINNNLWFDPNDKSLLRSELQYGNE